MKVKDPGHVYELDQLDGDGCTQLLRFVKREGDKYPGNVGHHPGVTVQELLRACIDRLKYVDGQMPHAANHFAIADLRSAIRVLEVRNARLKGRYFPEFLDAHVDELPTCPTCGHVLCEEHR